MRLSDNGLEFIKKHEGLKLEAYLDSAKVWTIGYGATGAFDGTLINKGMTITAEQAEARLRSDVHRFENAVNSGVKVPITQYQFDALVAFAFNVGPVAFLESTLLKSLNAGAYAKVPDEFMRWVFARGRRINGLVNRRKAEVALWHGKWP